MAKQRKKATQEELKARADKARATREANKAKRLAEAKKRKEEASKEASKLNVKTIDVVSSGDKVTEEDLLNADTKVESKVESKVETEDVIKEIVDLDSDAGSDEEIITDESDELVDENKKSMKYMKSMKSKDEDENEDEEVVMADDHIEQDDIRLYIGTAVTNQAQRAVESGLLAFDMVALRTFIDETCNQCQYGDTDRAFRFAIKCVGRVSSSLLM